jgi:hypothetical protein
MKRDLANDERRRWIGFLAFTVVCVVGVGVYIHGAVRRGPGTQANDAASSLVTASVQPPKATLFRLRSGPHVAYRSVRDGEFGRVVVASLTDPERDRFVTDLVCERAHFVESGGVCLVDNRVNVHPPAYALLLDERFELRHRVDLSGFPSRARMSRDGRHAATTVFTSGDDYVAAFSTRTMLIEHPTGRALPDLEHYSAYLEGKPFKRVDFNYWGVTFADDGERFFATLRTGEETYLMRGSRAGKELHVVKRNVECPSLSPDGSRLAFKKRRAADGEARIHVLDLLTLEDHAVVGEQRNIDDQVEWLDDGHLLYGVISDRGLPKDAMNVWVAEIPASSSPSTRKPAFPRIFLRSASSPAVVR